MMQRLYRLVPLIMALALVVTALFAAVPAQARVLGPDGTAFPQQDDGGSQTYENELLGLSVDLPVDWQALPGIQGYDLALVSPQALTQQNGAQIIVQSIPSLGAATSLESALEPIADQVESTVEPLTAGANEGVQVQFADEAMGMLVRQALFHYGTNGEAMSVLTVAPTDEDEMILAILDSLALDPPEPDYAAANAAWQTSVAEDGRMVYGDAEAPIRLVEFYSFTCPHCANYSYPLNRLIALDVEGGLVQIELVPIAGDPLADYATNATYCATEQGAGYSAYKALFAGSVDLGREYAFSAEGVEEILGGLDEGIDLEALNACIEENRYSDAMTEARTRFTDYGLTGTPTVLLGTSDEDVQAMTLPDGSVWSGSIPVDTLRTIFTMIAEEGIAVEDVVSELVAQAEAQ